MGILNSSVRDSIRQVCRWITDEPGTSPALSNALRINKELCLFLRGVCVCMFDRDGYIVISVMDE